MRKPTRKIEQMIYTIREAAEILGLNPTTIRRQIWNGEINAVLKGNIYLIPNDELSRIKIRPAHGPKKTIQQVAQS